MHSKNNYDSAVSVKIAFVGFCRTLRLMEVFRYALWTSYYEDQNMTFYECQQLSISNRFSCFFSQKSVRRKIQLVKMRVDNACYT